MARACLKMQVCSLPFSMNHFNNDDLKENSNIVHIQRFGPSLRLKMVSPATPI